MSVFSPRPSAKIAFATFSVALGTLFSGVIAFAGTALAQPAPNPNANPQNSNTQTTNTAFPDIQNHWAKPFIQRLAERNILAGYLDGTFRPNQSVNRDEFAAIIRKAFSQAPERQIASGSVYRDVPSGYWAAPAIEEAYQMGFMQGYPGRVFRPERPVSKVEAIVSLAQNLNLDMAQPTAATPTATTAQAAAPQTAPRTQARRARRWGAMPLAMGALVQPLFALQAQAKQATPMASTQTTPQTETAATPTTTTTATTVPVSQTVTNYYVDANKIPDYAVDEVAQATRAGIVVNHPESNLLRPTQPATRGEIAALIHQALVNQGRMEPLDQNVAASNYIVEPQNR